ncbi:unnamed protein product [Bemisia tabaci]|uniref:Uncharacterized protein n=1 Tax=Bemisia tabaci TaxID=7038 RepID=A0A9P0A265_BEMTA|nr:unnamed protein product [Bemisia tabaci]
MRRGFLFLLSIFSTALFFQRCSAASGRSRHWKGLLMFSGDGCENRCKMKHGFFKDSTGEYQLAAVPKRNLVLKCQCYVSRDLRNLIRSKYGLKEANRYGRLNFFGKTQKGRKRLKAIEFVTYDQLQEITAKRKVAEQERFAAIKRAAATTVNEVASRSKNSSTGENRTSFGGMKEKETNAVGKGGTTEVGQSGTTKVGQNGTTGVGQGKTSSQKNIGAIHQAAIENQSLAALMGKILTEEETEELLNTIGTNGPR